jgi:hypothetical protein
LVEPTSLNRGEGLVAGFAGEIGGVEGQGEGQGEVVVEKWWWRNERNERKSTMIWLMAVSNSARPP